MLLCLLATSQFTLCILQIKQAIPSFSNNVKQEENAPQKLLLDKSQEIWRMFQASLHRSALIWQIRTCAAAEMTGVALAAPHCSKCSIRHTHNPCWVDEMNVHVCRLCPAEPLLFSRTRVCTGYCIEPQWPHRMTPFMQTVIVYLTQMIFSSFMIISSCIITNALDSVPLTGAWGTVPLTMVNPTIQ